MKRNILVSVTSFIAVMILVYISAIIFDALIGLDDDGEKIVIWLITAICLAIMLFFITGRKFIKSTGNKKKDFLSVCIISVALYLPCLIMLVRDSMNDQDSSYRLYVLTNEFKYLMRMMLDFGCYLFACFVPSLCLWLGLLSKKWLKSTKQS